MCKTLSFFLCVLWAFCCSATSVSISEKTIAAEEAETLGFHHLIDGESGSWDDSWIMFFYPKVDTNGRKASEVCMDIYESSEKLASTCVGVKGSEIKGFNRSDIEVSMHKGISVDISITYGNDRLKVKNVASLSGKDYKSFKKRYDN